MWILPGAVKFQEKAELRHRTPDTDARVDGLVGRDRDGRKEHTVGTARVEGGLDNRPEHVRPQSESGCVPFPSASPGTGTGTGTQRDILESSGLVQTEPD